MITVMKVIYVDEVTIEHNYAFYDFQPCNASNIQFLNKKIKVNITQNQK